MSDPLPRDEREEIVPGETKRQPWQKLGLEKIVAADAEAAAGSGTADGTTYS